MRDKRADPSALRFLVGHELRAERERVGQRLADAAKVLGCTTTKIGYLESGTSAQRPEEVAKLLRHYGMDGEHVARVVSLSSSADQAVWWASFSDVLPDWFKTFVGLEGLAERIFTYQSLVLPGQVQTAGYAAGLMTGSLYIPPKDVAQVVRGRLARQRLTTVGPVQYHTVIDEAALCRVVGTPDVMREQLEHLLALIELDNVDIRVLPFDVSVHFGTNGPFQLLEFAEAQPIGYIEYPTGALYVQDQQHIHMYHLGAERLTADALPPFDTAKLIEGRIAGLEKG